MNIKLIPKKGLKFTFPALPEKIQVKYGAKYQSFEIISKGTVKIPKGTDAAEITWDGVFFGEAKKQEPIVKEKYWREPDECVNIISNFMKKETVLNLIVTKTWINVDVTISSFQPRPVGAYGNIEYTITFVQKKPLRIYTTKELKKRTAAKKTRQRNDSGATSGDSTYTVMSGDTLWKIAVKKFGNSTKWTAIYDANKKTIESAAKAHGKSSSDHGHWIWPGEVLKIPK